MSPASGVPHHLLLVGRENPREQQLAGQHGRAPHQVRRQPLPNAQRDREQLQPDRVPLEHLGVSGAAAAGRQRQHVGAAGRHARIQREGWVPSRDSPVWEALAALQPAGGGAPEVFSGLQRRWYQVLWSCCHRPCRAHRCLEP